MEHHRKQAKALARAFCAGDEEARRRAAAVLGGRERERFLLSDAQHVVAREQGHRTWDELKLAAADDPLEAALAAMAERDELEVETQLRYAEDEPVVVHVRRRLHRYAIGDAGVAARLAGRPPGWREEARRVVEEERCLNVARDGAVFVPSVRPELLAGLVRRVAGASLALYLALLELES